MQEREDIPLLLLHISDLHFGAVDNDKLKALESFSHDNQPDAIFVTGDIVNYPRPDYFRAAREFLDKLGCRNTFAIPGNHDRLFGGLFSGSYEKRLGHPDKFLKMINVKGVDLVIFAFDTTYKGPLFWKINNGHINRKTLSWFKTQIAAAKDELGRYGYESALKIALLHHHPLPTPASNFESMLYLHNSGEFLSDLAQAGVNLILHGHQHDPCYYCFSYDQVSFLLLSAGTATKADIVGKRERLFSRVATFSGVSNPKYDGVMSLDTSIFLVRVYPTSFLVEQYNFNIVVKKFLPYRIYPIERRDDPVSHCSLALTYTVKKNGDLVENGSLTLGCRTDCELGFITRAFGVNDESPSLDCGTIEDLGLKVYRNDIELPAGSLMLVRNEPRWKEVRIALDPPLREERQTITWTHSWPGGWSKLVRTGKDWGRWNAQYNCESLVLRLVAEQGLSVKVEDVSGHTSIKVQNNVIHGENIPKSRAIYYSVSCTR